MPKEKEIPSPNDSHSSSDEYYSTEETEDIQIESRTIDNQISWQERLKELQATTEQRINKKLEAYKEAKKSYPNSAVNLLNIGGTQTIIIEDYNPQKDNKGRF